MRPAERAPPSERLQNLGPGVRNPSLHRGNDRPTCGNARSKPQIYSRIALSEVFAMSMQSPPGRHVPELTARIARASNRRGTPAMWIRDRLDGLWDDQDFAEWYPRDGRPGLLPAQLATVSVLQFLLEIRAGHGPGRSPETGCESRRAAAGTAPRARPGRTTTWSMPSWSAAPAPRGAAEPGVLRQGVFDGWFRGRSGSQSRWRAFRRDAVSVDVVWMWC
jgi:hypothetical protein